MASDPAKTTAWCYGLGEGVEAEDSSVGVKIEVGWDETVQVFIASRFIKLMGFLCSWKWFAAGVSLLTGCGRVLKVPIWLVFDNDDIVFAAKGVDILTALDGQCSTSRILSNAGDSVRKRNVTREEYSRHGVHQMWPHSLRLIPILQYIL